ncbi:hypothetical protein ACJJTC_015081, partial [Scirpophaga incertulas]
MAEKRKRGLNFSLEDKDKLIKLLLQHKDTILNKKTDGSTNEAKNSAWLSITNSFNSTSNTHRNKESLMKMWEKLKSDSKKYYAKIKNNTTQTGGGPLVLKIDPVLEQVCAILGRGCTGVLEVPDCDAETGQDTEKVHFKIICTQNEFLQPAEEANMQTIAEVSTLEKTPINKTPLWSRRRPQISSTNERNEATSSVSNCIQNVYKKRESVEDLKEILLREELQFKRKLYELQLEAAAREVEIKTAILEKIKGK